MASGYGLHGGKSPGCSIRRWGQLLTILLYAGPGRCFPFWQEVLTCYVVNTSAEDDSGKKKCSPLLEDYYECLHHKKEVRNTPSIEIDSKKLM